MSTLLLISGDADAEQAPGTENSTPRRGQTLTGALERAGYEVVQAQNAASALARLGPGRLDLVVLAGPIPDMELIEFCTALRRDPAAEKVPFVLVAEASARTGRAASRAGADLVFPATIGPTEIADRLRRLF
jgi:CheY-like chemotaxis protein